MTLSPLSLEGFQDLLDRLGGSVESWPTPHRAAAEELLASSADARGMLEAAQAVEAALRESPKAPRSLVDRILAASGTATPKS